jgi:dCMP deaminase
MTNWDLRFLVLAQHIGDWSKDPSTKVGCVIVRPDKTIASMGYNGFPRGVPDHQNWYEDRSIKYSIVQHAETNAITAAREPLHGYSAFITAPPCAHCTGVLIQAGITRIMSLPANEGLRERFKDSFQMSRLMCENAGVALETYE